MSHPLLSIPEVQSGFDLFTAWVDARVAHKELPGVSIGLVVDQELVWSRGFGWADIEKKTRADEKTIYRIASISKLFTATAVMQLRDAGKLDLDAPVKAYLPWFALKEVFPDAPAITVRNLITHTSGLPRESAFPYWSEGFAFPERQEMIAALPGQQPTLPPFTKWKYSNLAVALAGEVVSAVSGLEYPEYVQRFIFDPLGMTGAYARLEAPGPELLATGYGRKLPGKPRQVMPFIDCKAITPAANLATNVVDLAKFAMLQFRKGPAGQAQILDGWTLAEMRRPQWIFPDWKGGWGLGFMLWRLDGKTYIGHGGSLQGFRTQLVICPEDKIAVVALTNSMDGDPDVIAEKAFKWVAPAIRTALAQKVEKPAVALEKYTGKYRDAWGDTQVIVLNGKLYWIDPTTDDPLEEATQLIPAGENTFRIESASGFGSDGETVVFEFGPDGKVCRIQSGYNYIYPVEAW